MAGSSGYSNCTAPCSTLACPLCVLPDTRKPDHHERPPDTPSSSSATSHQSGTKYDTFGACYERLSEDALVRLQFAEYSPSSCPCQCYRVFTRRTTRTHNALSPTEISPKPISRANLRKTASSWISPACSQSAPADASASPVARRGKPAARAGRRPHKTGVPGRRNRRRRSLSGRTGTARPRHSR